MPNKISSGTVHKIPVDLKKALTSNPGVLEKWNDLTPLARNEWVCWTISVKQRETREKHIKRLTSDLKAGKRRPCCWYGCIHRKDKKVSASIKNLVVDKKRKAK